jgi:hypothetical protein
VNVAYGLWIQPVGRDRQESINHFLGRRAHAVRSLNRTRLIQLRLTFSNPRLGGLFSGEGLALLVNLHAITKQTDLGRFTGAAVGVFPCADRGDGQLV